MSDKRAGKISNTFEFRVRNRYATRSVGHHEVVVSSIKYRHGELKNVGKIAQAVAEFREAGFEIEAITTSHANGFFRSFFLTTIVASKTV